MPGASSHSAQARLGMVLLTSFAAGAFAAAWHLGLWVVLAAGLSAAVTLAHGGVSRGRWLSSRSAAWALHAPHGVCSPAGLERAVCADLAAISGGDLDVLNCAQRLVEADNRDLWQGALASERLSAAADLVRSGLVSFTRRHELILGLAATAATAGAAVLLVIGHPAPREWFVVVLAPALVALCVLWRNQYHRRVVRPSLIAHAVAVEPLVPSGLIDEGGVSAFLITLAEGDARLLRQAAVLASNSGAPSNAIDIALARLHDASLAINRRRLVSWQALGAWWGIASAGLIAAARWLA